MKPVLEPQRFVHSPTLETIQMVERVLSHAKQVLRIADIKRMLPRKVNHNTLKVILGYLQESGKIEFTPHGAVWIFLPKEDIAAILQKGETMELKRKQKIVQIVGAAEAALQKLEENVHAWEALGKSPPKVDKQLLKSATRALDRLKMNPFAGNAVPQHLWPPEYSVLPNLFRIELSNFWRLLYYVTGDEIKVISVVFEICNHKKYDKIFGYDKK